MNEWQDAEQRIERAQQYCEARRWHEALEEIDEALQINPHHKSWWNTKAYVLDQLERYEEAIEAYEEALRLGGHDRDLVATLAYDCVKVGDFGRAIEIFEDLTRQHPDYEPAFCNLISLYGQLGDHDRAEQMFYLAQHIEEECPHCFWHLGCSLWSRDEIRRAVYCWQRVIEIDPTYRGVRRRIGDAYARLGDIEIAREYYLAEYREQPGDVGLLLDLGELLLANGRVNEASQKFRQAIELDIHNAEAYVLLGDCLIQSNDDDAAQNAYETAIMIDDRVPGIHYKLGHKLMEVGRYAEARKVFDDGLDQEPNDLAALMAAGNCALEIGDPDSAEAYFSRLIELDGRLPGAYHNLGVCHFLRSEYEQGIQQCEAAIELKADYGLARQKLVLANIQLGRWAEARRVLDESLALDPENSAYNQLRSRLRHRRLAAMARTVFQTLTGRRERSTVS